MSGIESRYRIATSAFDRPYESEKEKIAPNVIYFLSVEGDSTEYDYFIRLNAYLQSAYPLSRLALNVQTPRHSGLNSPDQVYDLLLQCAEIRRPKISLRAFSKAFKKKYGKHLEYYFDPVRVTQKELANFKRDLESLEIRYDIVNFVHNFGTVEGRVHPDDFFGMVIDRDRLTHTDAKRLREIYEECVRNDFRFCLSNPCFELWLYLHRVDVAQVASDAEKRRMLTNLKQRGATYMARLVKKKCGHGKSISELAFNKHYKKNLSCAVKNAKGLTTKMPSLLNKLGTNVCDLVAEMLDYCESRR